MLLHGLFAARAVRLNLLWSSKNSELFVVELSVQVTPSVKRHYFPKYFVNKSHFLIYVLTGSYHPEETPLSSLTDVPCIARFLNGRLERLYRVGEIDPKFVTGGVAPLQQFVRDSLIQGTSIDAITRSDIRNAYSTWCTDHGIEDEYDRMFRNFMDDLKIALRAERIAVELIKRHGVRYVSGIRYKSTASPLRGDQGPDMRQP